MNYLESIGLLVVLFTSSTGTAFLVYCAWRGLQLLYRQREHGRISEDIAAQEHIQAERETVLRHIERSAS